MTQEYAPARYPAPDWEGMGDVAAIAVPGDPVAAYLVRQDPGALSLLTTYTGDPAAKILRGLARDLLSDALDAGLSAAEAWADVLDRVPHDRPRTAYLAPVLADARRPYPA